MSNIEKPLNRRNFLSDCASKSTLAFGLAGLGAGLPAALANGAGCPSCKTENTSSYMKVSLAAYSFNEFLPRNYPTWKAKPSKAEMSLFDFVDYCASIDLDGCELTSYYFPAEITDEYMAQLKRRTFVQGLDISGTAIGNDFCLAMDSDDRKMNIDMTKKWIDHSAAMGAPVIRIFAGKQKKNMTEEEALELCVSGIDECLEHAAKKGVILALENHGGITATPEQLLNIVDKVKPSPYFGINFDGGNFRTADPYSDLEKIAPCAVNAQIKVDISKNGRGNHEPADIPRIIDILKKANYRGYIVLEYERKKDPKIKESIESFIKQIRDCF